MQPRLITGHKGAETVGLAELWYAPAVIGESQAKGVMGRVLVLARIPLRWLVFEAQSLAEPISGRFRRRPTVRRQMLSLSRSSFAAATEVSSCSVFCIWRSDWRGRGMGGCYFHVQCRDAQQAPLIVEAGALRAASASDASANLERQCPLSYLVLVAAIVPPRCR